MSKITVLDEQLINKIAAGEVIERPASVVKELMENSLDAKATKIVIEIKDSGKKLIKVSDNGLGMNQEDAEKSILRHATSKIKTADDLFSINTLGFRGEALASIAAVSRFSLTTKQKDQLEAFNLAVEGGQIISSGILAGEEGTLIEIQDLFFNTPARKKFLKSDQVELRHIVDTVIRYALANPEVSFKLLHENHQLLTSPSVKEQQNNIASIYGINLAKELLEINYQSNNINVEGFIAKPYQARNDKSQQVLFVNGRWIKNEDISKAVYDAYHSLLFVNKHPIFILNLTLNPQEIDVNVHPTKQEIKIEQIDLVKKTVMEAIKETLQKNNLIPILDFDAEKQVTFGTTAKTDLSPKYALEKSEQTVLQFKGDEEYSSLEEEIFVPERTVIKETVGNVNLPPLKLLGQIHKTFFVAETEGGLLLIDQHVVQERILYEKFMKQYMNKEVAVQNLLKGEIIEFNSAEKIFINENKNKLVSLGFNYEEFGENTIILKTIPTIFGKMQAKDLFYQVFEQLKEDKNKLEEIQEEIITRMACRASIKAGDNVTIPQMQKLLMELEETKLPYTCPHGRSVLIKITADELEKKFRRKG